MANPSLPHFVDLLNQQTQNLEILNQMIYEANSLVTVAIAQDFTEWPKDTAAYYMMALGRLMDIIEQKSEEFVDQSA